MQKKNMGKGLCIVKEIVISEWNSAFKQPKMNQEVYVEFLILKKFLWFNFYKTIIRKGKYLGGENYLFQIPPNIPKNAYIFRWADAECFNK